LAGCEEESVSFQELGVNRVELEKGEFMTHAMEDVGSESGKLVLDVGKDETGVIGMGLEIYGDVLGRNAPLLHPSQTIEFGH
jgi:hypothetical protein